jgi:hypothetical protein
MAADTGDGSWHLAGLAGLIVLVAVACGPSTVAPGDESGASGGPGGLDWVGRTVATSASAAMTVKIDADMTLAAVPGQGVGLFVEYRAGGHWQVSWSCDTDLSGQTCAYDVAIVGMPAQSATLISNVAPVSPTAANQLNQPSPQEVDVSTTTSSSLDGVTFDAPAGSSIEINALLGGVKDGISIFFVQDGRVDGGYSGALTDPLIFEPSAP